MPLDPNIPLGGTTSTQPQPNPLSNLNTVAEIQNRLNVARQFQQTFAARQAMGPIFQQAIDQQTGNIDYNKALSLAAQDPRAAFLVPEMANTIAQRELTQAQLGEVRQRMAIERLKGLQGAFAMSIKDPSTLSDNITAFVNGLPQDSRAPLLAQGGPVESLLKSIYAQPGGGAALTSGMVRDRIASLAASAGWTPAQLNVAGLLTPEQGLTPVQTGVTAQGQPTMTMRGALAPGLMVGGGGAGAGATPGAGSNGLAAGGGAYATAPSPYYTGRIANINKHEEDLDESVRTGAGMAKNVDEIVDLMRQAQMGGGADIYKKVGEVLQTMGFSNEIVDKWSSGSLPALQAAEKLSLNNAVNQMKQQITGGSKFNRQEFVEYVNRNPNIATDPRAAVEVFNLWKQFYDKDVHEQAALDRYKAGKPTGDAGLDSMASGGGSNDLTRWPAIWQNSDYMRNFGPGGPVNSAGVKGTGAAYASKEDVASAYQRGALTRAEAERILRDKGWAK